MPSCLWIVFVDSGGRKTSCSSRWININRTRRCVHVSVWVRWDWIRTLPGLSLSLALSLSATLPVGLSSFVSLSRSLQGEVTETFLRDQEFFVRSGLVLHRSVFISHGFVEGIKVFLIAWLPPFFSYFDITEQKNKTLSSLMGQYFK